jgi:hypothetical protein
VGEHPSFVPAPGVTYCFEAIYAGKNPIDAVAAATVDALRQLEPAAESIDVDHVAVVRVGAHDIAVVTIVFVLPPAEQIVAGSAMVGPHQEAEAVARAVLDATNRRLTYVTNEQLRGARI